MKNEKKMEGSSEIQGYEHGIRKRDREWNGK